MATFTGVAGLVHWDGDSIGEMTSFSLDVNQEPVEDTVISDTSRSYQAGILNWSGTAEVFWSDVDSAQVAMWTELLTPVAKEMIFFPEGASTGDIKWTGNALITSHSLTSSTNSMVSMSISFQGTGALVKGTA
tara:strand:- start:6338 stop:6736 length:399 start_codon:yes stop_codon:yes gene_type:complete